MIEVFSYRNSRFLEIDIDRGKSSDTAKVFSELKNLKQKLWFSLTNPTPSDFDNISAFCEIHPAIKEKIVSEVSRTKYEEFEDYTYVAMRCVDAISNDAVSFYYIYFIDGDDFLVTIQTRPNDTIDNLKRNSKKMETLLKRGEDFLLHYILDKEVDKYVIVRETIAEDLKELEETFLRSGNSNLLKELFAKERMILDVKRVTESITDLCLMLKKPTDNFISNDLIPYFADVYDHAFKANQSLKGYLDQIEAMRNTYLAMSSNNLNQSIQVLTIIMALMMPLTIITGFFGMNVTLPFQTNIHAYEILIFMMIVTVFVLVFLFKKFGWIGKTKR